MDHRFRSGVIALALAVTACGGDAAPDAAGDEASSSSEKGAQAGSVPRETVIARAADAIRPQPGLYRSTTEITEFDIPDAPPQVKEMMRDRGMSRQSTEYCLTPADVEKGFEESVRKSQQGDCDYKRFDVAGGTIEAAMTCRQDGRTVDLTLSGRGTRTSSDMAMTMQTDMGPMGKGTIRARTKSERIGDCPA